ncbi:MAG: ATP-binding protein [Acidimicrobiia bacterium]|nr:ATP-binding protein [Acidimicrobiia bacterium]
MKPLRERIRLYIPTSGDLDEADWAHRHRMVVIGYGLSSIIAVAVTFGRDVRLDQVNVAHTLVEIAVVAAPAVALLLGRYGRRIRQTLATTGVLLACGLMVHGTGGLIESHFSYFVLLPLVALYTDWQPYLYAVIYIAATHGVIGTIAPETMYNHPAAIANPFGWGVLHALYIGWLSIVMVVHWNFSDRRRVQLEAALHDLKATQSQLLESQKMKSIGSLAAGVAHEINTPIQFVGDNLRFLAETTAETNRFVKAWFDLQDNLDDPDDLHNALRRLRDIAEEVDLEFAMEELPPAVAQSSEGILRVAQIVRAMKGFSHPKNEIEASDLNQLIETTVTVSRSEWKYVSDLELDLDHELPLVEVPPGSFSQVILNLVVNAAHAIGDRLAAENTELDAQGHTDGEDEPEPPAAGTRPGRIDVATRRIDDTNVEIRISDNGCGVPDDVRDRIFDQFFTTKPVGRGTGQGLSIAHSLVIGLGGRIEIESEVGRGTTFRIVLPITQQTAPAADRRPAEPGLTTASR